MQSLLDGYLLLLLAAGWIWATARLPRRWDTPKGIVSMGLLVAGISALPPAEGAGGVVDMVLLKVGFECSFGHLFE